MCCCLQNEIAINPVYVDSSLDSVWKLKTDITVMVISWYSLKYATIQMTIYKHGAWIWLSNSTLKSMVAFFVQSPWLRVLSCECLTVVNGVASPQVWFRWASGTPCLFPTWRMHPMPQWRTCYRMCTMWSRWKSSYTGQCFPCTVPTGPPHTVLFFPQATAVGTHRHTSSFFCRHPCTSFCLCVCVCVCVVSRGCVAVSHFKVCRIQSLLFFCVCVCACLCANMDVLIAHYSSTTAHPITLVF